MNGFELWPFLLPVVGLLLFLGAWWLYRLGREVHAERARESFRLQKERLEGVVLKAAEASGKPRGLRWVSCRFNNEFTLVRDKATRRLAALIPVTVVFDPVPGGDMEGRARGNGAASGNGSIALPSWRMGQRRTDTVQRDTGRRPAPARPRVRPGPAVGVTGHFGPGGNFL